MSYRVTAGNQHDTDYTVHTLHSTLYYGRVALYKATPSRDREVLSFYYKI